MTEQSTSTARQDDAARPPMAIVAQERRWSWVWLLPMLAILLAAWLGWQSWRERGLAIVVRFPEAHGLAPGDDVRYRGSIVGAVRDVELGDDLSHVRVEIALTDHGDAIARRGTRFWIVRPQLRLTEVAGLETLVGPRYVGVHPSADDDHDREPATRVRVFDGLGEPPIVLDPSPDDLEITLEARARGSLHAGAPVAYRQVVIGRVLSVGLSSDGGRVEARLHIDQAYRDLIREGSVMWDAGGLEADLGISGLTVRLQSIEQVLVGGVAVATPPLDEAGGPVRTGARFRLAPKPREAWLEWEPTVAVGSDLLPAGSQRPRPIRATLLWKQGFLFKGNKRRGGWALPAAGGALIGPAGLLTVDEDADEGSTRLEMLGRDVPLTEGMVRWQANGVALIALPQGLRDELSDLWPQHLIGELAEPEDLLIFGDSNAPPLPVAANRLSAAPNGAWRIDEAVPIDRSWHGAAVLSRTDGRVVGLLIVMDDDEASIAPLAGAREALADQP